ncbi:MAG: 7-carboxy-7-deazaguanine synthase QueE [Gammaproteobacteria bacterium]|nr:7-carboxy-7-deazaguanine synthase QueE [Gammaproteobacteria bacterium]
MSQGLRVSEIFYSLQGESRTVGIPTVFVRLTGCPLRCSYCDTQYAFSGGETLSLDSILQRVESFAPSHVTVTGGEPLAQKGCIALLERLLARGWDVSLETSGAIDISAVPAGVSRVLDIKTPGSGEESKNLWQNISQLNAHDQIKFVICNRQDYDWAKQKLVEMDLIGRCELLFSPEAQAQNPTELAEWILADHLPVRFQVQLHKLLWGNQRAR